MLGSTIFNLQFSVFIVKNLTLAELAWPLVSPQTSGGVRGRTVVVLLDFSVLTIEILMRQHSQDAGTQWRKPEN